MKKRLVGVICLYLFCAHSSPAQNRQPQPKKVKNGLMFFAICESNKPTCSKFKSLKNEDLNLDLTSKLVLHVQNAVVKKNHNDQYDIHVELDDNSGYLMTKMTKENIGKRLAIVHGKTILTTPTVFSKITGNNIVIAARSIENDALEICQILFSKCKSSDKIPDESQNILKIPEFNRTNINEKYPEVMESMLWHTDKKTLTIYSDETKNTSTLYNPPMLVGGKSKNRPALFGVQEFDTKNKKFVYSKELIKLSLHGWIKRSDLVPGNILKDKLTHEGAIQTYYLLVKCQVAIQKLLNTSDKKKLFDDYSKMKEVLFRNSKVALCALTNQKVCGFQIDKIKKDSDTFNGKEIAEFGKQFYF